MPILLKRRNVEITPFRNAEFIPAYYFIPKSMLAQCGAELRNIPRNPRKLLCDWNAIATVESDLFQLLIIDAYAFYGMAVYGTWSKTGDLFRLRAVLDLSAFPGILDTGNDRREDYSTL